MSTMMKCGHAANAEHIDLTSGNTQPACAICIGITPDALVVDESPPDLSKRTARCGYYTEGAVKLCRRGACHCEQPSSASLPFFEHRPDSAHDAFYCGCWGWD